MFQLRYLIASDRRLSPVRFTHRSHRLQGTAPDDFHPGHKTFICDSYEQFREIFEHEVRHNPTAKIVPLLELHNPATGERRHLDGTEQVLTVDDLEAIQGGLPKFSVDPLAEVSKKQTQPLTRRQLTAEEFLTFKESLSEALKNDETREKITQLTQDNATVSTFHLTEDVFMSPQMCEELKPLIESLLPGLIASPTCNQNEEIIGVRLSKVKSEAGDNNNPPPPPPVSLADRIKPLVTEKKRTVTDLANDLGVSKDVVTTVVKTEGSGLTYASGWVGLAE